MITNQLLWWRNTFCWTIIGTLLFLAPTHGLYAQIINESEYNELTQYRSDLMKSFSPESHIFLFLGRSMTPLYALFNTSGPVESTYTLPLSRFQSYSQTGQTRIEFPGKKINNESLHLLFSHMGRYLPHSADIENKTLVLVDYAHTGTSLESAKEYIELYYSKYNIKVKIHLVAYTTIYMLRGVRSYLNRGTHQDVTIIPFSEKGNLGERIATSKFDIYAPHGTYYVSDKPEPHIELDYLSLVKEIAAFSMQSKSCQRFLSK